MNGDVSASSNLSCLSRQTQFFDCLQEVAADDAEAGGRIEASLASCAWGWWSTT